MIKTIIRKSVPHSLSLLLFLVISLTYFYPLLEGKKLYQSDIIQFRGMAREINDFREETGKEALWTNSMFGGMPAYLISVKYSFNLVRYIDGLLSLGLPRPAKYLFLSMLGFYILMLALSADTRLAAAGAIAFGFSTYFFIIGAVGHNTKAHAMCYIAPLLAGIVLSFRGKYLLGAVVTGIFLALQIYANHLQITYYTLLIVILYGIAELVHAIQKRLLLRFSKALAILIIPVVLAVGANFTNLYLVWEYGRYSMRGPSELSGREEVRTSGLDKDYILNDYSYGIIETMNLFIPNFKGGASSYDLGTGSEMYRVLTEQGIQGAREIVSGAPAYWGRQRYTAGPVYIGATVIFFFVFGLFVLKGRYKWWLLAATLLSVALAWGRNFPLLSEFFIDHIPGYDRFRTVSMTLVIAELTIPLLAVLGLREIFLNERPDKFFNALKTSFYILGGITLLFVLIPGIIFSFSAEIDGQLLAMGWPDFLVDALQRDRLRLMRADALRSFVFVTLSAGLLWMYLNGKIPVKYTVIGIALLFLADLWPVNRRFLSSDDFVTQRQINQPFLRTEADVVIMRDNDPNYRVYNTTRNPFNDAITSYHHKSVGGYHGAKMGRYQDLIDYHLSVNNMDVLNMLNTKYFIRTGENGQPLPFRNPGALGHAWFVDSYRIVENADEEILALGDFNPAREALVDRRFGDHLQGLPGRQTVSPGEDADITPDDETESETASQADSVDYTGSEQEYQDLGDYIELVSYSPSHLVYWSKSGKERLAVFSEVYYDKGWNAYINGEPADHFRVNYILRAMVVPQGENEIEFRFRPRGYFIGEWVSLAFSLLLIFLTGRIFWQELVLTTQMRGGNKK